MKKLLHLVGYLHRCLVGIGLAMRVMWREALKFSSLALLQNTHLNVLF